MEIIKRKMQAEKTTDGSNDFTSTQASFNSDGNITLRHYGGPEYTKDDDEIIVLSKSETQAIFELMRKIKNSCSGLNNYLPF